ncbi:MAG: hypothetical protein A2Y54_08915 [Chloroflexi bacterium RBG_16_51_16]|nr:MAG: hypothetical protein A2Y54_08915 [Chloroflexi bacterium RBG_16_51_16]
MNIKDFFLRLYRNHPIILGIIVILIIIIVVLLLEFTINFSQDFALNFSKGQLIAELISLIALIIAILEFIELWKKPDLRLWIECNPADKESILSDSKIQKVYQIQRLGLKKGSLNQDIVISYLCVFRFKLLIENRGGKVGHFIKLTLRLEGNHLNTTVSDRTVQLIKIDEKGIGKWRKSELSGGSSANYYQFYGSDDFIAYSHPRQVSNLRDWLEAVGEFELNIPVQVGEEKNYFLALICTIQAKEFDLITQNISISIPPYIIEPNRNVN